MTPLSKQVVRELLAKFVQNNPNYTKAAIVRHFNHYSVPRSSVYTILRRLEARGNVHHAGKGRVARKKPQNLRKKVIRAATENVGISQRLLARKFGISKTYVFQILKEAGIKYRKRTKAPQVTKAQVKTQKARLHRLARGPMKKSEDFEVIMDDESYFTYSGSQMPANAGFYASPGGDTPFHVKFKPEGKFPRKLLVWLAMSPKGVTCPVIMPSKNNVSGKVYREKCLKDVLVPFIDAHHPDHKVLFWPDLASAHYARETLAFLEEAGVPVVERNMNPPCAP